MTSNIWKTQSERENLPVFKMLSSGFWYHVIWEINTNISKESFASIFYPEDGGRRFLCNMGTYLPDCMTSHPKWQYLCSLCHENSHVTSVWVIFITVINATWVRTSQVINSVASSSHLLQIVCHFKLDTTTVLYLRGGIMVNKSGDS